MILVVDASLQGVSIALAQPGTGMVWRGAHTTNQGAVAAIAGLADSALRSAGLRPSDLLGLAVSVGPGSFTGIKVGLAFAYGFVGGAAAGAAAGAGPLPVLGMSALECAARRMAADGYGGELALFLPATRTHGYTTTAAADQTGLGRTVGGASLVDAGQATLAFAAETRILVAGRWPLLTENLKKAGLSTLEVGMAEVCGQAICGMAEEAAAAWPNGYARELPAPRYLRLSTAEEKLSGGLKT